MFKSHFLSVLTPFLFATTIFFFLPTVSHAQAVSCNLPAQLNIQQPSQTMNPGQSIQNTLTITNPNDPSCGLWYGVDRSYPFGWTESTSPLAVFLGGGQSQNITFSLTSPSNTTFGSYSYMLGVHDSVNTTDQAVTVPVQVVQQCNLTVQATIVTPSPQTANPGDQVANSLIVTNPNPASCGTNTYLFSKGWPSGWNFNLQNTLQLSGGETQTVPFSLDVSPTASGGDYSWNIWVGNSWADGSGSADLSGIVHVTGPTPTPIPTSTPLPTPVPTATPANAVQVISPNGGEVLNIGDTYRITWSNAPQMPCGISYTIGNNLSTQYSIANLNDGTVGFYDWQVSLDPTIGTSSNQVKIFITCWGAPSGTSANYFTIQPAPIPTETPTPTSTPQGGPSESPSPTLVPTETPSPTPSPTDTPSPTPTATPVPTPTQSPTPTPSPTPIPTPTPTPSPINLGNTQIGPIIDSSDSNYMNGSKVTTGANSLKVSSLSVYVANVDAKNANRSFQVAIYTDKNGKPDSKVAVSSTGTLTANAWNKTALSANLSPNTSYWLMFNTNGRTDTVNNMKKNTNAPSQGAYSANRVTFGTWPQTFGQSILTSDSYSLFATGN